MVIQRTWRPQNSTVNNINNTDHINHGAPSDESNNSNQIVSTNNISVCNRNVSRF